MKRFIALIFFFINLSFISLTFSQTIVSGAYSLLPGDELLVAVRYRTLRGLGQSNSPGDESYIGTPDLGIATNRKQHDFTWGTSSTWNFTFQYDVVLNLLSTVVTNGNNTYQDTIQNISTYIATRGKTLPLSSMNFMNILLRTNSTNSTISISNLVLNGVPIAGTYSATNVVNQWSIRSYNFGAGFTFTGTITTSGTFSTSQEGNKIEFSVGGANSLLPVVWGNISCYRDREKVILTWETLEEKDNNHFQIESSEDGINFSVIGEMKATSKDKSYYEFIHMVFKEPNKNYRYYRIRQVDIDGSSSYSPVVSIQTVNDTHHDAMVIENPVQSTLSIAFPNNFSKELFIIDVKGYIYEHCVCTSEYFSTPVNQLSSGIYWLIIKHAGKDIQVIKFIKC